MIEGLQGDAPRNPGNIGLFMSRTLCPCVYVIVVIVAIVRGVRSIAVLRTNKNIGTSKMGATNVTILSLLGDIALPTSNPNSCVVLFLVFVSLHVMFYWAMTVL